MEFLRRHTTARARKGSLVIGILFALAVVVGGEVYRANSVAGLASSAQGALAQASLAIAVALVATAAALFFSWAQNAIRRRNPEPAWATLATRRGFVLVWIALFCAWLPCLLAYWPGPFSYDIPTQTDFIANGAWTTQQPPIHTLIWALFLKLEGVGGLRAITWYALAQMAFLSGCFSAVLRFLAAKGASRILWVAACAFFALNPVIALFAITPVKDALLAGVFSLLCVGIAALIASPADFIASKARCAGFMACIVFSCLLRSNMLVAIAVFAVGAAVVMKESRKAVFALFAIPLAASVAVIGPVYALVGITPGSSAIASMPFQQVVNVVRNHAEELSAEEMETIDAVIPHEKAVERYNPRFADTVVRLFKGKRAGAAAYRAQLADFAGLWASFLVRYPLDCLDAFLSLNVAYWYPFAETPDPYSNRAYIETFEWRETPNYAVEPDSKAPALREAYERVADYSALDRPLLGLVFSPASVVWALALACYLLYASSARRNALLVALPLLFWASFLIGPVSNMRYLFPLFCLYPLVVCAALQPDRVLGGVMRT